MDNLIAVSKDGEYIEVQQDALAQHIALGWAECEKQESAEEPKTRKRKASAEE